MQMHLPPTLDRHSPPALPPPYRSTASLSGSSRLEAEPAWRSPSAISTCSTPRPRASCRAPGRSRSASRPGPTLSCPRRFWTARTWPMVAGSMALREKSHRRPREPSPWMRSTGWNISMTICPSTLPSPMLPRWLPSWLGSASSPPMPPVTFSTSSSAFRRECTTSRASRSASSLPVPTRPTAALKSLGCIPLPALVTVTL
mmetsp:Transcript_6533/g.15685  ORF Transcript_6533/g.15685 Transcript_6533/m.15685 type:complete len:201 (-) Transcript_6533:762-1364(-)